jgi:hypothetical protein
MFLSAFFTISFLVVASASPAFIHQTTSEGKHLLDVLQDEDAQIDLKPDQFLALFRQVNSITSDALEHIASYLKQAATENPSEDYLERFKAATALLRSLERSKRVYLQAVSARTALSKPAHETARLKDVLIMDEDTGEMIQAKINWDNVKAFGKGLVSGALSDEDAIQDEDSQSDVPLSDEIVARAKLDIKIAASTLTKDGPFADVLADPEARKWCFLCGGDEYAADLNARINWGQIGNVVGGAIKGGYQAYQG